MTQPSPMAPPAVHGAHCAPWGSSASPSPQHPPLPRLLALIFREDEQSFI